MPPLSGILRTAARGPVAPGALAFWGQRGLRPSPGPWRAGPRPPIPGAMPTPVRGGGHAPLGIGISTSAGPRPRVRMSFSPAGFPDAERSFQEQTTLHYMLRGHFRCKCCNCVGGPRRRSRRADQDPHGVSWPHKSMPTPEDGCWHGTQNVTRNGACGSFVRPSVVVFRWAAVAPGPWRAEAGGHSPRYLRPSTLDVPSVLFPQNSDAPAQVGSVRPSPCARPRRRRNVCNRPRSRRQARGNRCIIIPRPGRGRTWSSQAPHALAMSISARQDGLTSGWTATRACQ